LLLRLHRWTALTFFVLVSAFFVSGVFLMYSDDIVHWTHSSWYHATGSAQRITPREAVAIVQARDPKQFAFDVWSDAGVYRVSKVNKDGSEVTEVFVDPGTGRINASVDQAQTKRPFGRVGDFFANLHNCALSCEGMPGYVPFMAGDAPLVGWKWKSVVMIIASLAVIFLAVSGLVRWWPGLRRWKRGFRLRRKTFHVFNFDLHHVLGFVAIPFLLMWGITAITLALPESSTNLWHSATGSRDEVTDLQMSAAAAFAKPSSRPELSLAEATRRALSVAPGTHFSGVIMPDPSGLIWGQPAYYYFFNLTEDRLDPAGYSGGGSATVAVGLYDGRTFGPATGVTKQIWDDYRLGLHFGTIANSGWRLIFLLFGLSPLILGFTGIVMWLRRRKSRRRRRNARTVTADQATS
jgi:uncharacterized iron-regulated membrane protein